MALETGSYDPVHTKQVHHWPAPDKNGDGEPVWEQQRDEFGNNLGRMKKNDRDGNQVRHYKPPKGFVNVPTQEPGADGLRDNYVLADDSGQNPWRHPVTEECVGIRPGWTVVLNPDGSHETLKDDYSRYQWEQRHVRVGGASTDPSLDEAPEDAEDAPDPKEDSK